MRVIAGNRPLDIRSSALRHGIMFKIKDPINGGCMSLYLWWIQALSSLPSPSCIVATIPRCINRCVSTVPLFTVFKTAFSLMGNRSKPRTWNTYSYTTRGQERKRRVEGEAAWGDELRYFMDRLAKRDKRSTRIRREFIADSSRATTKVVWFPTSWRDGATIAVDTSSDTAVRVRVQGWKETELLPAMKTSRGKISS